jgi:hypothetical protein
LTFLPEFPATNSRSLPHALRGRKGIPGPGGCACETQSWLNDASDTNVLIHCLEILDRSVMIEVDGVKQELVLERAR